MSFIDNTYFVGEINIPNQKINTIVLDQAIFQYEKEILIKLLGYKLYSLLMADLDVSGNPQTQIYIDLVNGAEFTHTYRGQQVLLKWEGLKNADKQSLIAYYTFYQYVLRDVTHLSGTGVIMTPSGKGNRASSVNKLVNAWERMRLLYGIIPPEFKRYYEIQSFYYHTPVFGCSFLSVFNYDASAYNFLFANRANYPEWIFKPQWNINAFGI